MIEWAKPQIEKVIKDKEKQKQYIEALKEFIREQNLIDRNMLFVFNLFKKYNFTKEDCYRICRLLSWKPIIPLTGAEEEWNTIKEGFEQNELCSSVFRYNKDNSTAHYIDGKIFSNDGGMSWYINKESHINITFPFIVPDEPEKVYLDKEGNVITNDKEKIETLKQAETKRREEIRKGEE